MLSNIKTETVYNTAKKETVDDTPKKETADDTEYKNLKSNLNHLDMRFKLFFYNWLLDDNPIIIIKKIIKSYYFNYINGNIKALELVKINNYLQDMGEIELDSKNKDTIKYDIVKKLITFSKNIKKNNRLDKQEQKNMLKEINELLLKYSKAKYNNFYEESIKNPYYDNNKQRNKQIQN